MASSINASVSGAGGLISTADNTGILNIQTAGTNAVTVDASQNVTFDTNTLYVDATNNAVGIGTTANLGGKLEVNATSGAQLVLNDSASTGNGNKTVTLAALKNGVGYHNLLINGYDLRFAIGGSAAEAMRISSAGDVFINATSHPAVGTEKFGVNGGTTIAGAFTTNSASNPTVFINNQTNGSITFVRFSSGSSGDTRGNITWNGSNVVYGTSSDYRLKENIVPMTGALDKVTQLKPVIYTWKETSEQGQGFIAHELQEHFPDAVSGEKDAVDEDGKPVYQGIDTSFLVATLTAAIQELTARVIALENK